MGTPYTKGALSNHTPYLSYLPWRPGLGGAVSRGPVGWAGGGGGMGDNGQVRRGGGVIEGEWRCRCTKKQNLSSYPPKHYFKQDLPVLFLSRTLFLYSAEIIVYYIYTKE